MSWSKEGCVQHPPPALSQVGDSAGGDFPQATNVDETFT